MVSTIFVISTQVIHVSYHNSSEQRRKGGLKKMLVSLEWLKDYVSTQNLVPEQLAEKKLRALELR